MSLLQRCSAESVKALFDSEETRNNRISLQANHQEVDVFCQSSDHERTMVIAFDKGSNSPAEKAILKKSAYKTMHLLPLPHHPVDADMKTTSRKLYWEVNSLWEKRSIKHQNVSTGGVDRRYSDMLIVASFATKLDDATNYFSLLTRTTTFILLPYPLHPFTTTT